MNATMIDGKRVVARCIVLIGTVDRLVMENAMIGGRARPLEERENHRNKIMEFLKREEYLQNATTDEKALLETPVGALQNAAGRLWMYESVRPLLYSVGLVKGLLDYGTIDQNDYHELLQIRPGHDLAAVLSRTKPISSEELAKEQEIAMLWHWRSIEGTASNVKDWREAIVKSFGSDYAQIVDALPFKNGDFSINRNTVGQMDKDALMRLRVVAENRQRAFEWLSDQTMAWDEVPTDT